MKINTIAVPALLGMLAFIAACGGSSVAVTSIPPTPTQSAPIIETTSLLESGTRLTVVEGTTATYRVTEELAGIGFPTDAVGTTELVAGSIAFDDNGEVVSESSKLSVDLRGLKSDDGRRDNYIRQNTLQTSQFPMAELVITKVEGLNFPLPVTGEATFQIIGDLTIRGITKSLFWDVMVNFSENAIAGTASTEFTFQDYDMTPPRVFLVLSVEDEIRLQVDFTMTVDRAE
ncbi:MAG: YceI family protein [Chloroflexi bacterium]|nr:YceI family protein [Chloroflexota bacterium]